MRGALCMVVGAYTGVVAALLHRHDVSWSGSDWWWGLVASVLITWLVARAAGAVVHVGSAWVSVGWLAAILSLQSRNNVVVAGDAMGWSLLVAGLAAILFALAETRNLAARGPSS